MLQSAEFWVLVSFSLFIILCYKPVSKKLGGVLDGYSANVKKELEEARALKTEAKNMLADYQKKHREAVEEAKNIVDHAKGEADNLKKQTLEELSEKIVRHEKQAMDRIAHAKDRALAEVKEMSVNVAIATSTKILSEVLQTEEGDHFIDEEINALPSKLN